MTITRKLTSMATAAAIAATALVPLATTAGAAEWRQAANGGNYSRDWDGNGRGDRDRRGSRHWDGDRDDGPRHHRRYGHRRHKDNTGKYIAIGLGALMLGIIASEAGRH